MTAAARPHRLIPTDREDTDCPENWTDTEHKISRKYNWYESCGVRFSESTIQSQPYLSVIE